MGRRIPWSNLVLHDANVTQWVAQADLRPLFAVEGYTGIAESRALELAHKISDRL